MTMLQSTSPASLRSASSATGKSRGGFGTDPRPYLVNTQRRKTVLSTQKYLPLFPHEPEDARLTGSTRSRYRRLLALNLPGAAVRFEASSEQSIRIISGVFDPGSKIA